jgi:Helix-turn-helix domain
MRRGVGADFPQQHERGRAQFSAPHTVAIDVGPVTAVQSGAVDARRDIAKLFFDLRLAMRMSPQEVAHHIRTTPAIIEALERGQFEVMPPWPDAARIVMAYAAIAGIDGRSLVAALAEGLRTQAAVRPQSPTMVPPHSPVKRLRHAGTVLANGAKRLPAGAMKQVRERPERAFYAVSLPLAIVVLLLNTSALQAAFDHVPRPVSRMAQTVRQYFQVQFAPVREGLRWIEIDDPRRRRGDKLPIHQQ